MDFLQTLPTWAAVLLGLLAAVMLVVLNIGWLLQAKAMLDAYANKRSAGGRQQAATRDLDADASPHEARLDRSPEGRGGTPPADG